MPASLPPLTWFRAFECAARHLSFTHAAQELNVTQSAVSQHIRALESKLATKLFLRKARGLALTDAGRRLLPHVAGAIGELAKACEIFVPEDSEETLEISCATSFALIWLIPRIKGFRDANPRARIRISSTLWPDHNLTALSDLQIRFGAHELVGDGATLLFSDQIVPICAPRLLPAVSRADDLWSVPLIHTIGLAAKWRDWAIQAGARPPPGATHMVDSSVLATELAKTGNGVALASRFLCRDMIEDGVLCVPVDCRLAASDGYFLARSEAGGKQPLAQAFSNWILAEIARAQAGS